MMGLGHHQAPEKVEVFNAEAAQQRKSRQSTYAASEAPTSQDRVRDSQPRV